MSVLKPRNRLVYFRVSEDEFQQFNKICESVGARSISDLARSAIQRMVRDGNHHAAASDPVSAKLTTLEMIVGDLDRKVQHLTSLLATSDDEAPAMEEPAAKAVPAERKA